MFCGNDFNILVSVDDSEDLAEVSARDDVILNGSSGQYHEVRKVIFVSNLQGLKAVTNIGAAREVLGVDEVYHVLEGEALRVCDLDLLFLLREPRLR